MSTLCRAPLRHRARRARPHRARRHGLAHGAAPQAAARRQPDVEGGAQPRAHRAARRRAHGGDARSRASRRRRVAADAPRPLRRCSASAASANDEEIRRAYKRQREIYATGGLATASLLDEARARAASRRASTRRTTRCSIRCAAAPTTSRRSPSDEPRPRSRARIPRPALAAEQLMLQAELAREIGPDTEFTGRAAPQGARVAGRRARRDQRAHEDLAARTSPRSRTRRFDELPATVYVRGFVIELAKYLRLDPAQVQRTYLRRMREKRVVTERARTRARARAARGSRRFAARRCSSSRCAAPLRGARAGPASRCGTGTTTTSARGASPAASATRTIVCATASPCGIRGVTTRSATAAFSAAFYRVFGARPARRARRRRARGRAARRVVT